MAATCRLYSRHVPCASTVVVWPAGSRFDLPALERAYGGTDGRAAQLKKSHACWMGCAFDSSVRLACRCAGQVAILLFKSG